MSHKGTTTIFAAKEAKDNFGRLLDEAQRRPVTIQKKGRNVAVVLSMEEYNLLEALEDAWWAQKAMTAMNKGFIGKKKSEALQQKFLNA